jgi:hypothetical protein
MTRLQQIRQLHKLEDFAETDGFEYVGNGLVLLFVKEGEGDTRIVLCSTTREARREIKTRQAAGWDCRWRVFGRLHLPKEVPSDLKSRASGV